MKKIDWLAGLLLLIAGLAYVKLQILDQAPNISVTTISGQPIILQQLRGKPVVVTFWATDCASCIKEIPGFVELYNRFHNQGFELIAIAMAYDPPNHVVELSQAMQLPYPIALDISGEYALAFGQIKFTPTTFLIAPDGLIAWQQTGPFELADLQARIESFLKG